jgi:hypothetical protein
MHSRVALLALIVAFTTQAAPPHSSFGPEISAEDFHERLRQLHQLEPNTPRTRHVSEALLRTYLQQQLKQLGLPSHDLACGLNHRGLYAVLAGSDPHKTPVLYMAQWQKPAEVAALLEIAERFMTERPRPAHDVLFLFSPQATPAHCDLSYRIDRIIHPMNIEIQDASTLVHDLNALQKQGL